MKLKSVKFMNSIPINGVQNHYFSHPDYEIDLEDSILIRVKDVMRGGKQTSSIFNMIHCEEFESSLVKDKKK